MFVSHLSLLWRNVCLVLWPIVLIGSFIFLELSCRSCLYIFEINSLSVSLFAIIFSHSEGCLFTLLIVSFIVQKLLSLIRSHLFIGFPGGSDGKVSACNVGDLGSKEMNNPFQYACLENSMDREAL